MYLSIFWCKHDEDDAGDDDGDDDDNDDDSLPSLVGF